MASSIVTLLTDFGNDGPYVGAMKGAILSINPDVTIVDIAHDLAPGDIRNAAFVLAAAVTTFPPETIHVAVVDPGVGSARRSVALSTGDATFIAPDNGLLSYVIDTEPPISATEHDVRQHVLPVGFKAVTLTAEPFWKNPVSRTFHGRDIFAPVAAHLSLGVTLEELGPPVDSLLSFPVPRARHENDGSVTGEVLAVDRFGNLVTCIRESDLPMGGVHVEIAGQRVMGLSNSYAEADGLLAIMGSAGYLEISVRDGSASAELGVGVGTRVRVTALG